MRPAEIIRSVVVFATLVSAVPSGKAEVSPRRWLSCDQAVFSINAETKDGELLTIPRLLTDLGTTLLLGRATRDTVLVGQGLVFHERNTFLQRDRRAVYGQIIQVERVAGVGENHLRSLLLTAQGRVETVVVPWGVDMACGPNFWHGTAQWTAPDSNAVYAVQLRPDSLWVNGRPTFDALNAEVRTYARGPNLWVRVAPKPTAQQVFDWNVAWAR